MADKKPLSDLLIEIPEALSDIVSSGQISVYCDSAQTDCANCMGAASFQCGSCEDSCKSCESCQSSCEKTTQCGSCQSACQTCMTTCQVTAQKPTATGSLSLRSTTADSVTLRLSSISGADYYEVVYRKQSSSSLSYYETDSRTVTIDGLEPSTTYVFNYRGVNDYGSGPLMSTGLTVTTDSGKPTESGDLTLVSKTDTTIRVTFTRITDADYYEVYYRKSGSSSGTTIETTARTITIDGLTPNTEYVINYRGANDYGVGPFTTSLTVRTKISFWSWTKSNGSASASQTKAAYTAVTSNGKTSDFSYLVWNDLVDKVYEAALLDSSGWRINSDTDNMSYSATRMSSGDRVLTAARFNAVRSNIGQRVATGISHVSSGDIVKGSYFITLTDCLNTWADKT